MTFLSSDSGQCSADGEDGLHLGLVGGQPHPHRQPLQPHLIGGGSISSSDENDDENDGSSEDVSCSRCSSCNDIVLHAAFDDAEGLFGNGGRAPFEGQPLIYCTKGSICSRRSRATVLSRNVRGKRKKPRPLQQKSITTGIKGQNASVPSTIENSSRNKKKTTTNASTTSAMMVAFAGMVTKKAKNHGLVGNHASSSMAAGSLRR